MLELRSMLMIQYIFIIIHIIHLNIIKIVLAILLMSILLEVTKMVIYNAIEKTWTIFEVARPDFDTNKYI